MKELISFFFRSQVKRHINLKFDAEGSYLTGCTVCVSGKVESKKVIIPKKEQERWNAAEAIHHIECSVTGLVHGALTRVQAWLTPIKHGRSFFTFIDWLFILLLRGSTASKQPLNRTKAKIWGETRRGAAGWPGSDTASGTEEEGKNRWEVGGRSRGRGGTI